MLETKPAAFEDEWLTSSEICRLRVVLGYDRASDNQYCVPDGHPESLLEIQSTAHSPVFELSACMTRRVGSRTVLFARGTFRSGTSYAGIFYPADAQGLVVEELMLQAPDEDRLKRFLFDFRQVVDSVSWSGK